MRVAAWMLAVSLGAVWLAAELPIGIGSGQNSKLGSSADSSVVWFPKEFSDEIEK